jgi:hypothetical protein
MPTCVNCGEIKELGDFYGHNRFCKPCYIKRRTAYRIRTSDIYKDRYSARDKIRRCVQRGWIPKPIGTEFHHPDYSRPYWGVWLSPRTHDNVHAGTIPCPTCFDYTDDVETKKQTSRHIGNIKGGVMACAARWNKFAGKEEK